MPLRKVAVVSVYILVCFTHLASASDLADFRKDFFKAKPTEEAAQRLKQITEKLESKLHYQLHTNFDVAEYYNSNHDLALWYVKELLRTQWREVFHGTRRFFREENERKRIKERALEEKKVRNKFYLEKQFQSREVVESDTASVSEISSVNLFSLGRFITDFSHVIESLTNNGIIFHLGTGFSKLQFDPQNIILNGSLASPILDFSFSVKMLPADRYLPISRAYFPRGAERYVVAGGQRIPGIDASASLTYQVLHHQLNCTVSRQVWGPVSAEIQKDWGFVNGEAERSVARLTLAFSF